MEYSGLPLKDIIEMLIGEWSIRFTEDGTLIGGLAGLDYAYLTACFLLAVSFILICVAACYVIGVFVRELFYTMRSWR